MIDKLLINELCKDRELRELIQRADIVYYEINNNYYYKLKQRNGHKGTIWDKHRIHMIMEDMGGLLDVLLISKEGNIIELF